jgi:hypothetical protein
LLVEKFRVELHRWVQVDSASLLPLSIALKVIEHVRYIQRGLTVHQLSNSLNSSGGGLVCSPSYR